MKRRTVIIYHENCWDGVVAALCAWTQFGDAAEYVPMAYQKPTPWENYYGADVYFVDFSWPRVALEALATVATKVVVLDHHKNMGEQLMSIPRHAPARCEIEVVFDNTKSGARLAFERFVHPITPCAADGYAALSLLVDYVEDRDLWHRSLPCSREFTAALNTFPKTLQGARDAWAFLDTEASPVMAMAGVGVRVLEYQRVLVEQLCSEACLTTFGGHDNIPVCNIPQTTGVQSEAGEYLVTEKYPGSLFAVVYGDLADGDRRWSMRSRKLGDGTQFDVSTIARQFGGNGHPGAAGFVTAPNIIP